MATLTVATWIIRTRTLILTILWMLQCNNGWLSVARYIDDFPKLLFCGYHHVEVANLWLQNSSCLIFYVSNVTWHQLLRVALVGSFLTSNVHVCQTSYLLNPYVAILWLHCSKPALVHLNNQLVITIKSQFNKKNHRVFWMLHGFHYPDTLALFTSCYFVATTMQKLQICGYS